ncbi:unnamed protein product [Cladocopium goreaui]|uniref:Retrovirus-related Pol polyprotein from transposon TNT 1-94 n=1 Tax=Cladocopium goreaui TaxID=2562237 RepID=A0A9P1BZ61_9DINO|nr:unnamed protein product [Cladocopium goreaui]
MIFLNGRAVTSRSRSQKSIALSSCESEYLAAVGGGAEGIHIGRLWTFLVRKETEVDVVTDSSSCRAFAQRQGVGRLKHIETKYLWLQQCVKLGMLTMTGVATLLNVADIGTKKLSKLRRSFLMFLMGMVVYDEATKSYVPVGEAGFNEEMRKKALSKNMKVVRQVMLNTLSDGAEGLQAQVSKPMVKLMTLLAMQPMVDGFNAEMVELKVLEVKYVYLDFFMDNKVFVVFYTLVFVFIGVCIGYFIHKVVYIEKVVYMTQWSMRMLRRLHRRRELALVDDWDPMNHELKQLRVLADARDADSGEEFFRETETGLAKYVRPRFEARRRLKVEELDPLEASMLVDPQLYPEYADENAEEENKTEDEPVDAQVQTDFSPMVEHRGPEPHVPHETVELPGSPPGTPDDLPDLPRVGLDWQNLDVAEEYFPRQQRERTQRVREDKIPEVVKHPDIGKFVQAMSVTTSRTTACRKLCSIAALENQQPFIVEAGAAILALRMLGSAKAASSAAAQLLEALMKYPDVRSAEALVEA